MTSTSERARRAVLLPFRLLGGLIAFVGAAVVLTGILLISIGTATDPVKVSFTLGQALR